MDLVFSITGKRVGFASGAVAIGSVLGSICFELRPRVMVSSTNALHSLTAADSARPSYPWKP